MSDITFSCPQCDQHIAIDAAAGGAQLTCPTCGATVIVPSPPGARSQQRGPVPVIVPTKKHTKMAVTSLVLGILSVVCLGILAGIPAIILGHMAYNRTRKQPRQYGGGGLAIAGFACGYASVLITGIVLGLTLPLLTSLDRTKERALRINCVNNLKQVGLSFRVWEIDHDDRFPFNVPAKEGGTLELCASGTDGFDANAWRHFQVLSNELSIPKILVCPSDSAKQAASDFVNFGPGNVSYQVRSGTNIASTNPEELLARCPFHNNELMCDGSVQQRPPKR